MEIESRMRDSILLHDLENNMDKNVEILSPAGSYESLIAAIAAGADAVYIGGTRFGARAYADNLREEQLLEAIDYVHLHGKKIYLTINTLLKEEELRDELYDYLLPYYRQGIDAVIVQDIGVLRFVREQFPDLPIHASTQMTVTNVLGAKFLENLGIERVVTSREMQLDEIKKIAEDTNLEIESFVHGALCYCYSGQCLYSSLIGGRSGNRGQCAQPCRLPYQVEGKKEKQYILSLKDICTLEHIPSLIETGIYSFKIEGRMKKPEYVALVTAMYRKYVDLYMKEGKKGFQVEEKDREMLMDLYNRGGFHDGYYMTQNGREMLSLQRPNHAGVPALKVICENGKQITANAIVDIKKGDIIELPDGKENYTFALGVPKGQRITITTHKKQDFRGVSVLNRIRNESLLQEIKTNIIEKKIKQKVNGRLILAAQNPATLLLDSQNVSIEVHGESPQVAINQPIDLARVEQQVRKTGNTPFEFQNLEIQMEEKLFLPMQALNELRRVGLEKLEQAIVSQYRREEREKLPYPKEQENSVSVPPLYVYVEEQEQWEGAISSEVVKRIYLDCNAIEHIWDNSGVNKVVEKTHQCGKQIFLAMPHVFRQEVVEKYESGYDQLLKADWDGILVRNYESYLFLKEHAYDRRIVTDHNLYQLNRYAKEFWQEEGIEGTTAPLELNYRELESLGLAGSELIVYGYLPMMISAQCIKKTTGGCEKQKGKLTITDRYQKAFAVKNRCDYCYNILYNTSPLVLLDQKMEILHLKPKAIRLHFTIEGHNTVEKILKMYEETFYTDDKIHEWEEMFTRGHFKRGIK